MSTETLTDTDRIDALVKAHTATGLLRATSPMNPPGAEFVTDDVFVGRNAHGDRLYLSLRLARRDREQETTEHDTVTGAWELSLQGGMVDKGRKGPGMAGGDWSSCGQITDEFARVIGVKGVKAVTEVWNTYHLSGTSAACAHQERDGAPCPLTGYRYGSEWLYRPLPADAVATVLEFLAQRL